MRGRADVDGPIQRHWLVVRQDSIHDALDLIDIEFLGDACRHAVYEQLLRISLALRSAILELEDKGFKLSRLAAKMGPLKFVVIDQVGVEAGARRLLKTDSLPFLWLLYGKSSLCY